MHKLCTLYNDESCINFATRSIWIHVIGFGSFQLIDIVICVYFIKYPAVSLILNNLYQAPITNSREMIHYTHSPGHRMTRIFLPWHEIPSANLLEMAELVRVILLGFSLSAANRQLANFRYHVRVTRHILICSRLTM